MKIRTIIIFSLSILLSNSITSKIDNILSKGIEIDSKEIKILNNNYGNDNNLLILKGLMAIEGEVAQNYFQEYLIKEPKGDYAELCISKLGEYNYSKGLYIESSKWYKKIPNNYPASNRLETSISYFLNALVISGQSDSARYYANLYKKKYPEINSLNDSFLSDNKNQTSKKNKFSVKVGSYDKLSTALYYKNILQKEKFSVIINEEKKGSKIIYHLLIGEYKNKKNAVNVKKRLLSRLGISDCEIIDLN